MKTWPSRFIRFLVGGMAYGCGSQTSSQPELFDPVPNPTVLELELIESEKSRLLVHQLTPTTRPAPKPDPNKPPHRFIRPKLPFNRERYVSNQRTTYDSGYEYLKTSMAERIRIDYVD